MRSRDKGRRWRSLPATTIVVSRWPCSTRRDGWATCADSEFFASRRAEVAIARLYAAAGAAVTVVDISAEMLALDRAVARERGFDVRLIETSMDDLSMFSAGEFDSVVQPVSTCYVPDVQPVFREVARVTRPGGVFISQHKSPVSLQTELRPSAGGGEGYAIVERYYRTGPLPAATEPSALRERGTLEFLHRWEELVGGMCRSGFVIEDFLEPLHAKMQAEAGSFGHRAQYVAPYVRIKARRMGVPSTRTAPLIV